MLNRLGGYGRARGRSGTRGEAGSFGCADPETGLAIGYVMNQLGLGALADPRGVALVREVYACAT